MGAETPDFSSLSETSKREVAERLLKIEESGWKPFWCGDAGCDGSPHWWVTEDDSNIFVDGRDTQGPAGQPVGPLIYETPAGDLFNGEEEAPVPEDTLLGRPVLDPTWSHNHARVDQRLPPWVKPWTLMVLSGRGAGKTTTGLEFVTLSARKGVDGAIVGRRGTELENTHVAGLMERAHPEFMPTYLASKDLIIWPNGAKTFLFSAERPENIRSVNLSYFWFDEAAWMDEIEKAWMNANFAARVKSPGNPIHFLITSTPTPTPWVMKMEDDDKVEVRRVSTYANRANLDPQALAKLEAEFEGTRMGRQELHGEVLRDVEGALWNDDMFKHLRVDASGFADLVDSMDDVVLAVDPAGSKGPRSDATGIIGVGAQHTDDDGQSLARSNFSVLCDATLKGSPTEWAEQVFKAARLIKARRIVAEKNFGGDMVKQVLQDWAALHQVLAKDADGDEFKIDVVRATEAKEIRAEGTVAKYEQGTVTHVTSPTTFGDLSSLEKEQLIWVPKSRGGRSPSPNRVDALVWAVRGLENKVRFKGQMATMATLTKLKGHATAPGITGSVPTARNILRPTFSRPKGYTWPTKTRGR